MRTISTVLAAVSLGCVALAQASAPGTAEKVKTAGETFKNVQVLRDVPADRWFGTMAFIAASLGVTCDHCHTSSFDADDGNPAKLTARKMMRMVADINQNNFHGKTVVTCNTCHRGTLKPQAAPLPNMEHWMEAAEKKTPLPAASEVLARYRRAVGIGTTKPPRSQSAVLEIETYGGKGPGKRSALELLVAGPDRARMISRDGDSRITLVKDGANRWVEDAKGRRAMDDGEAATLRARASMLDPDQAGEPAAAKTVLEERVYDRPAWVVEVQDHDSKKWLYFDTATALLLRKRIFFPSIYAEGSVDVEYADYRKISGLQLPFTVRVINAGEDGLSIRRMTSRKLNVATKERDFTKAGE